MKKVIEELKKIRFIFESEEEPFKFRLERDNPVKCYGKQLTHYEFSAKDLWEFVTKGFPNNRKFIGLISEVRLDAIQYFRDIKNMTFEEIADIFEMSRQGVYQLYLKSHAPEKHKTRWSSYRVEWRRLFIEENLSIYEIAKRYKASTSVVSGQLKKTGVETGEKLKRKIEK